MSKTYASSSYLGLQLLRHYHEEIDISPTLGFAIVNYTNPITQGHSVCIFASTLTKIESAGNSYMARDVATQVSGQFLHHLRNSTISNLSELIDVFRPRFSCAMSCPLVEEPWHCDDVRTFFPVPPSLFKAAPRSAAAASPLDEEQTTTGDARSSARTFSQILKDGLLQLRGTMPGDHTKFIMGMREKLTELNATVTLDGSAVDTVEVVWIMPVPPTQLEIDNGLSLYNKWFDEQNEEEIAH